MASEDEEDDNNLVANLLKHQNLSLALMNREGLGRIDEKLEQPCSMRNDASLLDGGRKVVASTTINILCSIPEDQEGHGKVYYDDEGEPTYHRSPVTIANGYRPCYYHPNVDAPGGLPRPVEATDAAALSSSSSNEDLFEHQPHSSSSSSSVISLIVAICYILRCFMILAALFVVFVLVTHPPAPAGDEMKG